MLSGVLTHLTGFARELLLVGRFGLALGSGCAYFFFVAATFEAATGFYFVIGAGDFAAD